MFTIDLAELEDLKAEFGATEKQMVAAYNRALTRTAGTLRKNSSASLKAEGGFKNAKALRKRLKDSRIKSFKEGQLDQLRFWYGLNRFSIEHIKGKITRLGTKKNPKGVRYTPKGAMRQRVYKKAFIEKKEGRRSIFRGYNKQGQPIGEARIGVKDALAPVIKADISNDIPEIFMQHFLTDIKGRTKANIQ